MDLAKVMLILIGALALSLLVVPIKDQKLFWFVAVPLGTLAILGVI